MAPGRADVPAKAVLTTAELLADPYLQQRGTFVTIEHPERGPILIPGFPLKMSASSVPILPAPLLGQLNEEVYGGMLGIPSDEFARLRQASVI
jgi:crotonobetainyl-CoA:carnitine CoA-transferase CaiB-like acyl-CoA transferase